MKEIKVNPALAKTTQDIYRRRLAAFRAWRGRSTKRITAKSLCRFIDEKGIKEAQARQLLAAIKYATRGRQQDDPTQAPEVAETMMRIARAAPPRRQARALDEEVWQDAIGALDGSLINTRDKAMLGVMRACLLRASEVMELNADDIDEKRGRLVIKRSKTDQTGRGATQHVPPVIMAYVREWLDKLPERAGPAFRRIDRHGNIGEERLHVKSVCLIMRSALARAGIDPAGFSSHSARVGMAQDLAASGASTTQIQMAGRWRSANMPAYYARNLAPERGAVADFYEEKEE